MFRFIVISSTILAFVANFAISTPLLDKTAPTVIDSEIRDTTDYRLPNITVPSNYKISLTTNIHEGKFDFTGVVEIKISVTDTISEIKIHHRQLKIISCAVTEIGPILGNLAKNWIYDDKTEILTIETIAPLNATEEYNIKIEYSGELRGDNAGFYKSYYKNNNNETVWLATTQFESTDARHGFPCYDEPQMKAKFEIDITHGTQFNAISNMPVQEGYPQKLENGMSITKFMETELMSTYLIAFVVSDFESSNNTVKEFVHKVYSQPEFKTEHEFALQGSVDTLRELSKYLDNPYTFPKMDQIAVPDFAAGAMENWGLVTYREEYLLWDPENSPETSKTGIARIISHEYVHQWFGNLVSPKWWTYIWLNEGFATLFSYIGVDLVHPKWNIMEYFIITEYQESLASDGHANARPMTHYVEKPNEIAGLFDSVAYGKAGNVLRMFQHTLGENTFKKGLQKYLKEKKYDSATDDDLFNSLTEAAVEDNFINEGFDLGAELKYWTNQGGYPLLTVTRNYETGSFQIKQEQFLANGGTASNRTWHIPFNYVTGNNANFDDTSADDFMTDTTWTVNETEARKLSKDDWLLLNKQQTGFYRVNYDENNWKLLKEALEKNISVIHVYNRAQLIDDAFKLVLAGKGLYKSALGLMEYLKKETEYAPWAAANNVLTMLNNYFKSEKDYPLFKFYAGKLMENFFKNVGTNNSDEDSHLIKYSRNIAINWACELEINNCLEDTSKQLKALVADNEKIHPNLQSVVFCNGLKNADYEEYQFINKRMLDSKDQAERRLLMSVLGCSMNITHLTEYLLTSTDQSEKNNYRVQERINILGSVYGKSIVGITASIDFLLEHAADYAKIGGDFTKVNPLVTAIRGIAQRVVNDEQKEHFDQLLLKIKDINGVTDADIEAAKATVQNNIDWVHKNKKEVFNWLVDFKKRNSATSISVSLVAIFSVVIVTLRNIF